jgi:allantoinase
VRAAAIHLHGEQIGRIAPWSDVHPGAAVHDAGDMVVMPGLVDTHVHVNEPGRTLWEGFNSATRAAAAGGITTMLDMPLNAVPATTTARALEAKRIVAAGKFSIDVGFIGGVVPGNVQELIPLADAGVLAFKCFLTPSGVDEFKHVTEADLAAAFPTLEKLGLPLMVHAEAPEELRAPPEGGSRNYADYLASRPPSSERAAIETMVRLMDRWPARVHVVHLSSGGGLAVIRAAQARGLPMTAETCPHYLFFAAEEIPEGATEYKCAPPIREQFQRDVLWQGLLDGEIDMIVSDHSPAPPAMKPAGDFFAAWGGIASLQLGLPVVWTAAAERGVGIDRVARWMCTNPAARVGLGQRKGVIAPGYDADIVVWDPDASFVVDPARLYHRHPLTPYAGRRLRGVVNTTYLRGQPAYRDGQFSAPRGKTIASTRSSASPHA